MLGGIVNALGATRTTLRIKITGFMLVSASGTIHPAGMVNDAGHLTRLALRTLDQRITPILFNSNADISHIGGAHFAVIHFNGILNSSNSIVPLFRGRVGSNNPLAIARPGVAHCFVAVPRTTRLMVRTNSVKRKNSIFMLSVKRPMGVMRLTRGVVRLSNLDIQSRGGLRNSVSVRFANLHPNRGLCRRLLVKSGIRTARRPVVVATDRSRLP